MPPTIIPFLLFLILGTPEGQPDIVKQVPVASMAECFVQAQKFIDKMDAAGPDALPPGVLTYGFRCSKAINATPPA